MAKLLFNKRDVRVQARISFDVKMLERPDGNEVRGQKNPVMAGIEDGQIEMIAFSR